MLPPGLNAAVGAVGTDPVQFPQSAQAEASFASDMLPPIRHRLTCFGDAPIGSESCLGSRQSLVDLGTTARGNSIQCRGEAPCLKDWSFLRTPCLPSAS